MQDIRTTVAQMELKQGMSYAIQLSDGRFIMIDGGEHFEVDGERLYRYLCEKSQDEKPVIVKKKLTSDIDADAAAVYDLFGNEPLHPDEISLQTGFAMPKVISSLMMLEISGFIKQTNGKNYVLNQ